MLARYADEDVAVAVERAMMLLLLMSLSLGD